jgi:hypothetical protein
VDQPRAHIFLRPIGSPLTIGMSGLAIASLVQSGFDLRRLAKSQTHEVGLVLLTAPFVLASLRFVPGGVYDLGATAGWRQAAGIVGLVVLGLVA